MASAAMMNNPGPVPPESFLDAPPYGWLSPRISFSHDFSDDDKLHASPASPPPAAGRATDDADLDFEFRRVDDPGAMLTADELFSDGKLLPRQLAPALVAPSAICSSVPEKAPQQWAADEPPPPDPYAAFSPKAPTCTSQWRELLRRRRATKSAADTARSEAQKSSSKCSSSSLAATTASATSNAAVARSLKHLLHRSPRTPLSSAADYNDRPRRSLDVDKSGEASVTTLGSRQPARVRLAPGGGEVSQQFPAGGQTGRQPTRRAAGERSASVDSPRVNSSGKVVFQGLGRSSSSPSSLHGGAAARGRHRAADVVRVAPVLNVPVSVFGLGQLFSGAAQKREPSARSASSGGAVRAGGGGKTERS